MIALTLRLLASVFLPPMAGGDGATFPAGLSHDVLPNQVPVGDAAPASAVRPVGSVLGFCSFRLSFEAQGEGARAVGTPAAGSPAPSFSDDRPRIGVTAWDSSRWRDTDRALHPDDCVCGGRGEIDGTLCPRCNEDGARFREVARA